MRQGIAGCARKRGEERGREGNREGEREGRGREGETGEEC